MLLKQFTPTIGEFISSHIYTHHYPVVPHEKRSVQQFPLLHPIYYVAKEGLYTQLYQKNRKCIKALQNLRSPGTHLIPLTSPNGFRESKGGDQDW